MPPPFVNVYPTSATGDDDEDADEDVDVANRTLHAQRQRKRCAVAIACVTVIAFNASATMHTRCVGAVGDDAVVYVLGCVQLQLIVHHG